MKPCLIEQYINEKRLEGTLRSRLEESSPSERQALAPVLELSPSANTLQEILRLAGEIAARDQQELSRILSSSALASVIEQEDLNRKQKQKLLRQSLEDLRYPELKKLRDELEYHQKTIRKECGLRLSLPEDLEGDSLTLEVSARSPEDFKALSLRFEELAEHPSTKAVFAILGGRSL